MWILIDVRKPENVQRLEKIPQRYFAVLGILQRISLPGGLEPPTFRLTAERAADCATQACVWS